MKWEAALPKAEQWEEWLDYHADRLKTDRVFAFLVETLWHLSQSFVVMSRRLRKNPDWSPSMGERDWESLSGDAEMRLAWFKRERPSTLKLHRTAKELVDIADTMEGMLTMQVRIAREIEAVQRTGFEVVNVNPFQAPDQFAGGEEE